MEFVKYTKYKMRQEIMDMSVNRLNAAKFDFYKRDNRKKNFNNNQNKNLLEDFDLISLDNKEKNKQNLEEAARLIAIIQSDESGDFEKACKKHLTKISMNEQANNKGILELINTIRDFVSVDVPNSVRNFCNRVSALFCEDSAALIGSAISEIGRFCCDLCEAISTIENKRLKYSKVFC